jgi:N-acetylglucosamine-6-phosphate deacetylase
MTTSLLLHGGNIVLPDGVLRGGSLLIEQGQISSVLGAGQSPTAGQSLDLDGLTLMPGFIDLHIHGAVGVDTTSATAAELNRVSQFLSTQGITAWLPTLVPAPASDYRRAITAIENAMQVAEGARILGVHFEGPFVNSAQCGALRQQYFRTFSSVNDLEDLPMLSGPHIHMMTLAPEIEGGIELVRELVGRGWVVSIGHTRADYDQLDKAFDAGVHHMTHFMNAMAPLHHRSPGPIGWGLVRDDVSFDVIADGVHLDSHVLRLLLKVKSAERMVLISDAIAATGLGEGDYQIWGESITVRNGRTSNARGSIAGSVISMLDAVRLMTSLGATELEISRMVSQNPARLLGLDKQRGSIEEGKRADLVALDATGSVHLTIAGGNVVFQTWLIKSRYSKEPRAKI